MRRWLPLLAFALVRPRVPPDTALVAHPRLPTIHTAPRSRPLSARATPTAECGGDVVVLDEDTEPVNDATVVIEQSYLRTDAEGLAHWPDRPCGRVTLSIRVDDTLYPLDPVDIRGEEDIVITLPSEGTALVQLVDADCEPVDDVPTRPASISAIEPLGDGRWQIWGPEDPARLPVRVGHADQVFTVPLDGALHTYTVRPARQVWVDSDADSVWCSGEPCPRDGTHFLCDCPYEEAHLRPRSGGEDRPIPDDATRVRVSAASPTGRLRARWSGPLPCTAKIEGRYGAEFVPCGEDIVGEELDAAPLRLEIRAEDVVGARLFDMSAGTVDIGVVAPGDEAPEPGQPAPWPVIERGEIDPGCEDAG